MEFEIVNNRQIIKVIGVGGGGSNAVNHMFRQGIKGVDFLVCNTDAQALEISPVTNKIQLGSSLTEGRGAGSLPEVGKNSAIETIEEIRTALGTNTKMVFITAGMGGGTGTGAAPIIAGVAREMGILTVGIVTIPFAFEGKKRKTQAQIGMEELKRNVDTLLVICNDKLRMIHGDLALTEAFGKADDILTVAAKSIAEIITVTGYINVDFADVQTVLKDSGVAIMGRSVSEGQDRAAKAAELALESPLLNDSNIKGARHVLLSINSGNKEVTMDEIGEITDFIQMQAGETAEIIFGTGKDESLGDKICLTIIATGFAPNEELGVSIPRAKVVLNLEEQKQEPEIIPVVNVNVPLEINENPVSEPVEFTAVEDENHKSELDFEVKIIDTGDVMADSIERKNETEVQPDVLQNEFTFLISEESGESNENMIVTESTAIPENREPSVFIAENKPATNDNEEVFRKTRERLEKLREMSFKTTIIQNNNHAVTDLEKEPAYKRRQMHLSAVPDSSQSIVSRYTLSEDADKKTEIKQNNTFLYDRVD